MSETSLPLPDVAEKLGVKYTRVRQLVGDHKLIAYRNGEGILVVPAAALVDRDGRVEPLGDLRGCVLTLLDAGFSEDEAVRWLLEVHPVFGRAPIELLREGAHKRVNKQARAEAF